MKSLSSACLSLNFFKIGSLVFSDSKHDDSWSWYLLTDEARFLEKKLVARIWAQWASLRFIRFFTNFLSLDYTFSLKLRTVIACNNVYHIVEIKLMKKYLGSRFGPSGPKSGPNLDFFAIFSSLAHYFSFKLHRIIAWNNA